MGTKTVYITDTTTVGGTKIEVRRELTQAVGQFFTGTLVGKSDPIVSSVGRITQTARHWLQLTIPLGVSAAYIEKITPAFTLIFKGAPDHKNLNTVWSVLKLINIGLNSPFAIKIAEKSKDGTHGYVSNNYTLSAPAADTKEIYHPKSVPVVRADGTEGVKDGYARKGEIHIWRGSFVDEDRAAGTLIHEAGHRYANLEDFGADGYINDLKFNTYKTLTSDQCLRNADSYSVFVRLIANPDLAKTIPQLGGTGKSNGDSDGFGMFG